MNYSSKIFEMLGVKPNKSFRIKVANAKNIADYNYFISDDLSVYYHSAPSCVKKSNYTIQHFLHGDVEIIKPLIITPKEKAAIDYARACGCKWLARDASMVIYAFENKPQKYLLRENNISDYWEAKGKLVEINVPISFIKWEDEEPFYIGPEVTFKVVDEYESIDANETLDPCIYFDNTTGTCINLNRCLSNDNMDKCKYFKWKSCS